MHGVLWLNNAPDVSKICTASDEEKQEVIKYFDELISTMHPNVNEPPAPVHPCRVKVSQVTNDKQDLAQLLNKVQRHTICTPGYCLKGKPPKCRFKFPIDFCETTTLDCSDPNNVQLVTRRNDKRLNKYNKFIIQTWRGNIDVSPVLSKQALVNYLAKYISKSEKRSQPLVEMMSTLISDSVQNKAAKHVIQRLFIKTCSERDYSAQETCHILMGLKLYSTSGRKFISINFNEKSTWVKVQNNAAQDNKTFIEKYMERPDHMNEDCMWNMAKYHNVNNRKKFNIVQVFPLKKLIFGNSDNEEYYKQQCMLYLPWRNQDTLKGQNESWQKVYEENLAKINDNKSNTVLLTGEPDEDAVYDEFQPEVFSREQGMLISAMRPNNQLADVELGMREIDLEHNWHDNLSEYDQYGGVALLQSFLANSKKTFQPSTEEPEIRHVQLSEEQQKIIDLVKLQIQNIKNSSPTQTNFNNIPKRVIVQGKAGTGKSLVISIIAKLVRDAFGHGSILILGPTGVSALNVNGSTYHSKLQINQSAEYEPLSGPRAHNFCAALQDVKFVIIDEYSMVGCSMMNRIDQRLRQATGNSDEDFGGLHLFLFGDIKQLAPVFDAAPYYTNQSTLESIRGKQIYDNFDATFSLTKIHRQSDEIFLKALDNISMGTVTLEDYNLLKTRFTTSVTADERRRLKDALHLFPTVNQVDDYNTAVLESLTDKKTNKPVPVARVLADHNCPQARQGSLNDADGLEPKLFLAKGAKIMLRKNLWTEQGLVNGAIGHIVDIVYNQDSRPSYDAPALLICHFPSYKGPYLDPEKKTVPIITEQRSWTTDSGIQCTREQFPVSLAYATTVHKSQGLTLEMVSQNIRTTKWFCIMLNYQS